MRRVVNDDVVRMVGERAHTVGDQQTEPPVSKAQFPEAKSKTGLEHHDRQRDQAGPWVSHHQMPHLGMRFNEGTRPPSMRMVKVGLEKSSAHQANLLPQIALSHRSFQGGGRRESTTRAKESNLK